MTRVGGAAVGGSGNTSTAGTTRAHSPTPTHTSVSRAIPASAGTITWLPNAERPSNQPPTLAVSDQGVQPDGSHQVSLTATHLSVGGFEFDVNDPNGSTFFGESTANVSTTQHWVYRLRAQMTGSYSAVLTDKVTGWVSNTVHFALTSDPKGPQVEKVSGFTPDAGIVDISTYGRACSSQGTAVVISYRGVPDDASMRITQPDGEHIDGGIAPNADSDGAGRTGLVLQAERCTSSPVTGFHVAFMTAGGRTVFSASFSLPN